MWLDDTLENPYGETMNYIELNAKNWDELPELTDEILRIFSENLKGEWGANIHNMFAGESIDVLWWLWINKSLAQKFPIIYLEICFDLKKRIWGGDPFPIDLFEVLAWSRDDLSDDYRYKAFEQYRRSEMYKIRWVDTKLRSLLEVAQSRHKTLALYY